MEKIMKCVLSILLIWFVANVNILAASTNHQAVINNSGPQKNTASPQKSSKVRKQERKEMVQKMREQLKVFRKTAGSGASKGVCVLISIFLPFIGVLVYENSITTNFWISLILWFLLFFPGFIYALLVIFDVI